ncbi:hypothetical protein [Brucella intermedia]|uniref:hypothetical protein n=1 Tax=Brucella intermedia TaxID=94625 RepID=UPI00185DAC4F|nr:hypothetical protein [Brucella intermedia]NYD84422.1 hypothetical protein [Brucella intermedia]
MRFHFVLASLVGALPRLMQLIVQFGDRVGNCLAVDRFAVREILCLIEQVFDFLLYSLVGSKRRSL